MEKYFKTIGVLLLTLILQSCEKETMRYEGEPGNISGIYFLYSSTYTMSGGMRIEHYQDSIEVTFAQVPANLEEMTVNLPVRVLGNLSDKERAFKVKVSSGSAVEGIDYQPLQEEYVMPANKESTALPLVLLRTDKLKKEKLDIEAEKLVSGKGLVRVFINYARLPQFLNIYLGTGNEYIDMFSNSMDFAGLYFNTDHKRMEVKGYTLRKDTADPYIMALLNSGKHRMKAHEILSGRTALYTNIGFSNPVTFVKELENALAVHDPQWCESYRSSRKKIENLFDISLEENFLSWMSGEFAITQSEPGLLGHDPELILAIGTKSIKDARKNMEFIEKKLRRRTPLRIKTVDYKGFEINYVEMKGFFRLFFGGLFDKFEKPYYTYVDDYVVFSNKASSLLSFVEDYDQKNLLKDNPGFKNAFSYLNSSSTVFLYTDVHKFYYQLKPMMNAVTWGEIQSDKDIVYSFPYWTMQITGDGQSASLQCVMDYKPYQPEEAAEAVVVDDEADEVMNEDAETEKEQMSELQRFYVEKFEGNVLREFYPEGALKSEAEVKEGKRHGRYREYYENGKLKLRGKYGNNIPKGTWKYYTEEGEFERKEKY